MAVVDASIHHHHRGTKVALGDQYTEQLITVLPTQKPEENVNCESEDSNSFW